MLVAKFNAAVESRIANDFGRKPRCLYLGMFSEVSPIIKN